MYRLLIVDDEYQIVDWLYELFRGMPQLDLDVCKAYSGSEAQEWLNKTKIDIVISDICMPGMDGLQLADRIYKNWPSCKLIFLTGYNEFDYIYKAIKYDSVSYLLKTEEDEEVIAAVEKAVGEIEKSYMDIELINKAKQQMNQTIPLIQKEYMQDILGESGFEPEITQERFNELALPLNAYAPVLVILGSLDDFTEKIKSTSRHTEYMYAVKLLYDQYFSDFKRKFFTEYGKGYFVIFIQQEDEQKMYVPDNTNAVQDGRILVLTKGRLESVQSVCRESLDITISFISACSFTTWENVSEKVAYLKQLLDYCNGMGKEIMLTESNFPESIREKTNVYEESIKQAISRLKKIDALTAYLEHGQRREFFELLSSVLECLKNVKSKSYSPALEIYFTVSSCLLNYINKWMLVEKIAFKIGLHKLTQTQEHATWNDAVQYIYQLCNILFEIQKDDKMKIEGDSISVIRKYIDEHLNEELSLARLSDMLYFNPSYFSRIFKQSAGKNLTEYIQDARVLKAKKLLEETDMKIQDIAAAVGAESSTYFGYYFKKATEMSPNEYRDRFLRSKKIL
jgi:two-component system, response regulator YesN